MPMPRHPQRDTLIELAREHGWTPSEAAKTFGVSQGRVSRWFKEAGLKAPRRPGELPEADAAAERAYIYSLLDDGWTPYEIAKTSVYSLSWIKKLAKARAS